MQAHPAVNNILSGPLSEGGPGWPFGGFSSPLDSLERWSILRVMMKALRMLVVAGAAAALIPAFVAPVEGFEVPRHVYGFDRLAEAQNDGMDDKKPLLLLYADPKKEPT